MNTGYFDCFSGASGDMILGAVVSAGWPAADLEATLRKLGAGDVRVRVAEVVKQGIAATQVSFDFPPRQADRTIGGHLDRVAMSALPETVKESASSVLRRLGEAEARVHRIRGRLEDVHLHELGSLDTLFDIVGSVAGLAALDVSAVHVSPINLGGGTVNSDHGLLPVPAPAVAELVRGLPVYGGVQEDGELLTPTGAAILSTLGSRFGAMPQMTPAYIGLGAGTKEGRLPNVLRLWIGQPAATETGDEVVLLETNIDDMNPELYGPLCERLLRSGAHDAYLTPIIMKKGRPAVMLSALCPHEKEAALSQIIFEETTTLGIRASVVGRRKLERDDAVVETPLGRVRVKIGRRGDRVLTAAPEFEDCRTVAAEHGVPLKQVYDLALKAFHERIERGARAE